MAERDFIQAWWIIIVIGLVFTGVALFAVDPIDGPTATAVVSARFVELAVMSLLALLILFRPRVFVQHRFSLLFTAVVAITATMILLGWAKNDQRYVGGTVQALLAVAFFGDLGWRRLGAIIVVVVAMQVTAILVLDGLLREILDLLVFSAVILLGRRFLDRRQQLHNASLHKIREATAAARHDLQQPMTALNRWLYNLEQARSEPDRVAFCLSQVRQILSHTSYLINEVLELSRSNQEAMQTTTWGDVRVDELLRAVERVMGAGATVENQAGGELSDWIIHGEFDPVLRVTLNLTVNARRYSADGDYRIELLRPDEKRLRLTVINAIDPQHPPPDWFLNSAPPPADARGLGLRIVARTMADIGGQSGRRIADGLIHSWLEFQASARVPG